MGILRIVIGLLICGMSTGFAHVSHGSVLDSGKSSQAIAAEIINGARARYELQQREAEKVKMYATQWCGYCKKARKYFESKGIKFTEFDIEKDFSAKREYDRLGGKAVPLILVGNSSMTGFSEKRFERLYQSLK